jgi:hypothetical protein
VNARTDGQLYKLFQEFRTALAAEEEAEAAEETAKRAKVPGRFDQKKGASLGYSRCCHMSFAWFVSIFCVL